MKRQERDWELFDSEFRVIEAALNELLERTNAISAHIVDRSGQLVTSSGCASDFEIASFSALTAALVGGGVELASVVTDQSMESIILEGHRQTIFMSIVSKRLILCVVFDRRSTLGLVRFRASRASRELSEAFGRMLEGVGLAAGQSTNSSSIESGAVANAQEIDAALK